MGEYWLQKNQDGSITPIDVNEEFIKFVRDYADNDEIETDEDLVNLYTQKTIDYMWEMFQSLR